MKNRYHLILYLFFASILFSCSAKKGALTSSGHIKHRSANYLFEQLNKNSFNYEFMSMKASVRYSKEGKSTRFHAAIRIRKDSAIWVSITQIFGIEIARALITSDTIMFIDRFHKKYFIGNIDFLSKKFETNIDFKILQAMLTGNSTFSKDEKLYSSIDKNRYYLGDVKKRKYKKAVEKDKDNKIKNQAQILRLDTGNYKIRNMHIFDLSSERSLRILYDNYKKIDQQLFPSQVLVEIKTEDSLTVKIDYTKLVRNKPRRMAFNIPDNYVQIQ